MPSRFLAVSLALLAAAIAALGHQRHDAGPRPAGPPRFDLSTQRGQPLLAGFDPRNLAAGATPDEIPAITRPRFESPRGASRLLKPTDLVIGVEIGGNAHAYPIKLLSLHEVVNDVVGGQAIVVTWCPLCSSALVFDRRVDGGELTFGVSGFLYHSNLVLFDEQTRSLWTQLGDGAVTGAMRGHRLRLVSSVEQPWSVWRSAHPRTRVLSIRGDRFASRFLHPFTYLGRFGEERSDDAYGEYLLKVSFYYRQKLEGLSGSTRVVVVQLGGRSKAYPYPLLRRRKVVDDELGGGADLAVFWSDAAYAPRVFSRRLDGRVFRFHWAGRAIRDEQTGSRWSPATGTAVAGPLAGRTLQPVPFTSPYWFAWHAFYPETVVLGSRGDERRQRRDPSPR